MALKIIKAEVTARDEALKDARAAHERLKELIEAYNEEMSAKFEDIGEAVQAYNEARETLSSWLDEVKSRLSDEAEDKSERWQESDTGSAVTAWIEEMGNLECDGIEFPEPDLLEIPDLDTEQAIEDFPTAPEA